MHFENKTSYTMSWIFSLFYSWHFSQVLDLHIYWQVQTIEFYYIWREHANLSSVKQLKQKTWRISNESSRHLTPSHAIWRHIYGNG